VFSLSLTCAGLVQLPSLYGLSQLHTLTASFNKLAALTGLLPASEDAVAAAAAAAASEALEAFTQQLNAGGMRSTASSRPGTAGSVGGAAGGGCCSGGSQVDAVACILQQQQHRPSSPLASTQQKQQQHRPQSPIASTNVSRRGQAAYEAAYEQHVRQLRQLRVPSGVSSLPASLVQLQLAHNQLVVLPPELPAALPALTMLDVSHNR
jgi:Leucine-rich repeat (LRR) protein